MTTTLAVIVLAVTKRAHAQTSEPSVDVGGLASLYARPVRLRLISTEIAVQANPRNRVRSTEAAAAVIQSLIGQKDREHLALLHLSSAFALLAVEIAAVGDAMSVHVHPREVFKSAILANSAFIIVGHNHPSGDARPSATDALVFDDLRACGALLGIPVLDLIVVAGDQWRSVSGKPADQSASFGKSRLEISRTRRRRS